MKKYKLSEGMFDSFWNFLVGKRKPAQIQKLIDDDPELQQLDGELQNLIGSYRPRLLSIKKNDPKAWKKMVDAGLVPKNYN